MEHNYRDDAQYILELWKNDAEWWAMLRAAQADDVLIAGAIGGMFYTFQGQGQDVLNGIFWSDPYGNPITNRYRYGDRDGYSLGDFFAFSNYLDASWDGFIRWSEEGTPSFYARNDTEFYQQETPEWVRKSLSFGWNILSGSVGFFVPGDKVVKALSVLTVGAAITPSVDSLWLKVNGMQYGDVEVFVGDHRLVFHGLNDSYRLRQASWTWARESRMALRVEYWSE